MSQRPPARSVEISAQKTLDQHFGDGWHEFYLTLGGASAALVGLLFVGLSLHLPQVIRRPEIRGLGRQGNPPPPCGVSASEECP